MKKWLKKNLLKYYLLYKRVKARIGTILVSDIKYVKKKAKENFGVYPDLKNPKRYNEHISNILLSEPSKLMEQCADKYEVRNYVKQKIGPHILNEIYGVYNSVRELEKDWNNLPHQFVLKATHGCAWNYICKDKKNANLNYIKTIFKHWLKSNFYYAQRELIYKDLTPRIMAEQYLEDKSGGLMDYKFHCFQGNAKYIQVDVDRFTEHKRCFYNNNWEKQEFSLHFPFFEGAIEKPKNLERMIEIAERLSEDFNGVRVDLYNIEGKIYFGELTFTPGNGHEKFSPDKYDLYFGSFFNQ